MDKFKHSYNSQRVKWLHALLLFVYDLLINFHAHFSTHINTMDTRQLDSIGMQFLLGEVEKVD